MGVPRLNTPLGELQLSGEQAKALRTELGITQVDLAQRLGFTQSAISQFERSPELKSTSIAALAVGFVMTPQEFVRAAIKAAEKAGAK